MSQFLGSTAVAFAAASLAMSALLGAGTALAQPSTAVRPEVIYHNYCSVCHGDRGDGRSRARGSLNPPPADFTTAEARKNLSRERMILALQHGRPGTAMTPWAAQLSQKEMEAVVDFIRDTMMAPEPGSPLARGRGLYGHHCIACHGERGQGVASSPAHPAPRPFKKEAERRSMLAAVTEGRFGTLKHEFSGTLKTDEIESIVDYVRKSLAPGVGASVSGTSAHGGRVRDPGPAAQPDAPLPEGLAGSALRGKRLYDKNCAACHGTTGQGNGARAAVLGLKLREFAHQSAPRNRPALFAAIANGKAGTDMPAWSPVFTRQEIADVAEYVWRTFTAPAVSGKERL